MSALKLNPDELRVCRNCKEEKHISEFHKALNRADGLQTRCKECNSGSVFVKDEIGIERRKWAWEL